MRYKQWISRSALALIFLFTWQDDSYVGPACRSTTSLKGVPGEWRLFAVEG
jgi:hypothetical protein